MPMRTAVGHGRPVTKPSTVAARRNATTSPSRIGPARRDSSVSAPKRVRSPGSISVQPMRSPAAPATITALSSSIPWGRIRPQNLPLSPTLVNSPPAMPTFAPL